MKSEPMCCRRSLLRQVVAIFMVYGVLAGTVVFADKSELEVSLNKINLPLNRNPVDPHPIEAALSQVQPHHRHASTTPPRTASSSRDSRRRRQCTADSLPPTFRRRPPRLQLPCRWSWSRSGGWGLLQRELRHATESKDSAGCEWQTAAEADAGTGADALTAAAVRAAAETLAAAGAHEGASALAAYAGKVASADAGVLAAAGLRAEAGVLAAHAGAQAAAAASSGARAAATAGARAAGSATALVATATAAARASPATGMEAEAEAGPGAQAESEKRPHVAAKHRRAVTRELLRGQCVSAGRCSVRWPARCWNISGSQDGGKHVCVSQPEATNQMIVGLVLWLRHKDLKTVLVEDSHHSCDNVVPDVRVDHTRFLQSYLLIPRFNIGRYVFTSWSPVKLILNLRLHAFNPQVHFPVSQMQRTPSVLSECA